MGLNHVIIGIISSVYCCVKSEFNFQVVLEIKITISDLIYQAQKASTPVFGIDISKLSKKVLFNSEENNIHKLYQYVKEMKPDDK